ncbi:hypothetical protein PZA11_007612 [Diplocarpon coronariae]
MRDAPRTWSGVLRQKKKKNRKEEMRYIHEHRPEARTRPERCRGGTETGYIPGSQPHRPPARATRAKHNKTSRKDVAFTEYRGLVNGISANLHLVSGPALRQIGAQRASPRLTRLDDQMDPP